MQRLVKAMEKGSQSRAKIRDTWSIRQNLANSRVGWSISSRELLLVPKRRKGCLKFILEIARKCARTYTHTHRTRVGKRPDGSLQP